MDRRVTTQDISWFLDLNRNAQLDLNPPYQRRSVWSPKDRRFFLDSIFRGYPSPAIFLHKVFKDGLHIHEVVDGKQRLETILLFTQNKIVIDKGFGDTRLNGKKWSQLDDDLKRRFWDYVIPVEYIKIVEGTLISAVFDRLNRNSLKLERQELRHAMFDGWLINTAEAEAESQFWKDYGIVTTAKVKRMKDVQFILELMILMINKEIRGFDQDFIDEMCAKYELPAETDVDFDEEKFIIHFEQIKSFINQMETANQSVSEYAKSSNNLFSLWFAIALNYSELPSHEEAAKRFAAFMKQVQTLKIEQDNLEQFLRTQPESSFAAPLAYLNNVTGANTEPAQRKARHTLLSSILLGLEPPQILPEEQNSEEEVESE
ncbi:MAG: DUF262 domain-containing protein [Candidatus Sericytochromatia bacterium]|nr:DUF262 domain-containing protein [Candidatus Sericytochromatia bacterium]